MVMISRQNCILSRVHYMPRIFLTSGHSRMLYVDGVEKNTRTLKAIRNTSEDVKSVVFTWVAEPGEHRIKVVIDPDNNIIEVQGGEGDNNVLTKTVKVRGSIFINEIMSSNPALSAVLIILMAVVLLVGTALLIKARRRIMR